MGTQPELLAISRHGFLPPYPSALAAPWGLWPRLLPFTPKPVPGSFPQGRVLHQCDALEFYKGLGVEAVELVMDISRFELEFWSSSPVTSEATLFPTLERVPGLSEFPCYWPDPDMPRWGYRGLWHIPNLGQEFPLHLRGQLPAFVCTPLGEGSSSTTSSGLPLP